MSMKVWEIVRKPTVVVSGDTPATVVRAEMRYNEEPIAVVVESPKSEKVIGFITWREIIQITSHYSHLRAKDIMVNELVANINDSVDVVFEKMREAGVYGVPVVDENGVLKGVITLADIVRGLQQAGMEPIAETVAEVMTVDIEKYVAYPTEEVTKVWSDFVYHGVPGKVVLRSRDEPIPIGIITPREMLMTSRWFFHRESERGLKSVAKVRAIMLRGTPAATPETPIEYAAKIMAENDLTILPVVDDKGKLVGILTIYDVARAYLEGAKPGRVKPTKKAVLPIPVKPEERVTYATTQQVLEQVAVAKPVTVELIGLSVKDIMRQELPAITINDTVEHARKLMIRTKSNYLVVVDEKGEVIGAVTKWSMLRAIATKGPIWKRRVRDRYFIEYVMDKNLPKIPANASVEEAAYMLVEAHAEMGIVVDENENIIGFVTKDDIVKAYAQQYAVKTKVENLMMPGRAGIVHPHHSLHHAIKKMQVFYLDALTVYDGSRVIGVISANRLPFVALEDAVEGIKSRRLIWVRKLVKGGPRKGRYVKVTPLLVIDATVLLPEDARVRPSDSVAKAIELMEQYNVDGIPVVDEEGVVKGVICKNDIIRDLARTAEERRKRGLPVTIIQSRQT